MSTRGYIAALPALLRRQMQQKVYQSYTADCLKFIAENTTRYAGGSYPKTRYAEIVDPAPEESRTEEEIISSIRERISKISLA